jgi:GNAT superfamily N-acetyltransferase
MTADPVLAGRLAAHLESWLGAWPPDGGLTIVGSERRTVPGWDGSTFPVAGVATPGGAVLSVPPALAGAFGAVRDLDGAQARLRELLDRPGGRIGRGVFRWCQQLVDTDEPGEWVPTGDPRVPEWLRPFNGDVLIAWDDHGRYAAGVGRKLHDALGHEISVGTEPEHRGKGLARRLVAQAARRIAADGAVATYLHRHDNHASAKVAEASGFPDEGWQVLGFPTAS